MQKPDVTQTLFDSVDEYITTLFIEEDSTLIDAVQSCSEEGLPAVQVSPVQGKWLSMLAQMIRAERILEIGTLGGFSAMWMAQALPTGGRVITLDNNPHHIEVARANIARAGLSDVIEVRAGNALDTLHAMTQEDNTPFDMVFIDADKPPCIDYITLTKQLTRPGGIIVVDNALFGGAVCDETTTDPSVQGMQRCNAHLAADKSLNATIVPMVGVKGYDGMAIILV